MVEIGAPSRHKPAQTVCANPPRDTSGDDVWGLKGMSGSEYAELSRQVKQAGLLERRRGYYAVRMGAITLLLGGAWTAFVLLGDSWWQMAVAVVLAVMFTQAGFLGHDAGHRQIFRRRWANDLVGLIHGNLVIGLSYGWWIDKHNRHHAHPNQEGHDPDLVVDPIAFTVAQASSRQGTRRLIVRAQAYLFLPLLLLEAVSLHAASVRALAGRTLRLRPVEAALLAAHAVGYLTAVLVVLSPLKAAIFIVVQQGLFGLYMGCSFAPNHKGMPVIPADEKLDYLRRQVLTSRNVSGGWLIDVALGGLNYQIEHHLFPSMPRPNLRRAQVMVREFCQAHDLPYCQTSILRSWAQVLRHLHDVGRAAPQVITEPRVPVSSGSGR
jgi:fatty acid desaturase